MSTGSVSATVQVSISGIEAYDAAAALLVGVYDTDLHKYVAFAKGVGSSAKDWQGFAGFEAYTFELLSRGSRLHILKTTCRSLGYAHVYAEAWAHYKVTHSTWWGFQSVSWTDYNDLTADALIRCSQL